MPNITVKRITRTVKVNVVNRNITVKRPVRNIQVNQVGRRGPQGEQGEIGIGVPADGVEGQFLEKQSDEPYDFAWITPAFSGDKHYEQSFSNSAEVTVNHNLNKLPAVTVLNTAGDEVRGQVEHQSVNTLVVRFSSSFSGKVTCN